MAQIILWYLLSSVVGFITFPLAFRFLKALPDRGYSISRALGLLLWGYLFWILASLGLLANQGSSLFFCLVLLFIICTIVASRIKKEEAMEWWRSQHITVLVVELLFLVCFAGWAFVRGTNPEAIGTEKPMELAFINGILASPIFPPQDPWLSGFSISYYYFGYILVAMLAKLTATSGAVAFNLGIALVFALSAIGAYGLVFNLWARRESTALRSDQQSKNFKSLLYPLFGPLYILVISNLEGFLHVLHSRGIFWRREENGLLASAFWKWLDIQDLNVVPREPFTWFSDRFWWWWRASRVLQDYDLAGNSKEIIDEFPFFSYLLADLHPHVLAMPFAFLAISLAFNTLINKERGTMGLFHWQVSFRTTAWISFLLIPTSMMIIGSGIHQLSFLQAGSGVLLLVLGVFFILRLSQPFSEHGAKLFFRHDLGSLTIGRSLHIQPALFFMAAIILGSMAFLNTWDFPLYVGLFCGAHALGTVFSGETDFGEAIKEFLWLALCLGTAGVILFLPFYLGFSSQVGGIIPNLIYVTRGAHLWVMFAPLLIPILVFLGYVLLKGSNRAIHLSRGLLWAVWIMAGLWGLSFIFTTLILLSGPINPTISQLFQSALASPGTAALFQAAIVRRLSSPGGWITLLIMLGLALALFRRMWPETHEEDNSQNPEFSLPFNPAVAFNLLLILFGTLLVIGPEFFYLQDQFGWRINTIFKFYFQVWLIWGAAAAFSTIYLLENLRRLGGIVWRIGLIGLLAASMVYPVLSLGSKTEGFRINAWTLDSSTYLEMQSPEVMAAIRWLKQASPGIIAEGVPPEGGSYTGHAVISTQTGMPAVLGWFGHESQWRGGVDLLVPRRADLTTLYCSRDWETTQNILDRYQIRYIVVGNLEKEAYRPGEANCPTGVFETKFQRYLLPVFQQGQVTIYEYYPAGKRAP